MISEETARDLIESAYWRGWEACERDRDASWHALAHPVAHPAAYRAGVAAAAVRRAEGLCRGDAAALWERSVRDAMALDYWHRNPVQRGLAEMYGEC